MKDRIWHLERRSIAVALMVASILAWTGIAARGAEYFVAANGSDTNAGTKEAPFQTIQKVAEVMAPGDAGVVRAGVYRETIKPPRSGAEGKPIRFAAAPGETVTLSGLEPIDGKWSVYKGSIHQTKVDRDFIQLFVDGAMMVEARWPDMRFPGELWDRSKWARAGKGSRYGKMVDPKLAETDVDWTGALATLNVAHQFFTWTRRVQKHSKGGGTFEYARDLNGITSYADKTTPWEDDRYILSGKLEALDSPGEWFLDGKTHTLYLWPPGGKDPSTRRVEFKARNYAFEAENLNYITISGFRFFGATLRFQNCSHCVVEDCHLVYPTYARSFNDRSEKEIWAEKTTIAGDDNTVRKCSLAYSSTGGFSVSGSRNLIEDNLIHDVCWNGSLIYTPLQIGGGKEAGVKDGSIARRNTVFNFGNAGISFRNGAHIIELNHVYDGGLACKDVALIYTGQPTCAGSVVRYNWAHGCRTEEGGGLGIRGDDQTRELTVHHNVVWDCGRDGIIVKGDGNKVFNNTVLSIGTKAKPGNFIDMPIDKEPVKPWKKQSPLLERQNAHSQVFNNVALTITGGTKGQPFPKGGNLANNYTGEDPRLMDPLKRDFRPRKDSPSIDAGRVIPGFTDGDKGKAPDAGAYELGGENWRPGITWSVQ